MKLGWVAAAAAAALCAGADARGATTVNVRVYNFNFSANPAGQPVLDPTIFVGDTIRWVFEQGTHTTTSVQGIPEQWHSFFQPVGGTFEHTFTHVGTWHYFCVPHGSDNGDGTASGMAGTITVVPVPAPAAGGVLALLGVRVLGRTRPRT